MTDHTIEAHFKVESMMGISEDEINNSEDMKLIVKVAEAISNKANAKNPAVMFEAAKMVLAVKAILKELKLIE